MAAPSSVLAWRIPWAEEPGGQRSMGSQSQTGLKRLSTHAHTHGSFIAGFFRNLHTVQPLPFQCRGHWFIHYISEKCLFSYTRRESV